MTIKGKALIIIERLDSKWVPFDVTVYVQSCNCEDYYAEETWDAYQPILYPALMPRIS